MQEAMRASLSLQPSSSSRPSPTTLPQANDAVSSPEDNVLHHLKRLEQKVEDLQRSLAEFRIAWWSLVDGQVVTDEVANLKALIEGLNQALTLFLKRLTFFCEDYKLYQHVCGKEPQQSRIGTLVNEVALVAHNDMKYTYKFARNAIVSQITQLDEASHSKRLKETCVICFENTNFDKMFSIDGCLHRCCLSCMKKHVEFKLLAGMEAKCPHEGCYTKVSIDSCREFLAPELLGVLSQKRKESSIPITKRVYCPYPECSELMSKSKVFRYTKITHVSAKKKGIRKCMKCHCLFCIKCKVPWHSNMTCNEYKRSKPYSISEDAKLESLRKEKRWSQCVKCQNIVELAEGCVHITCRCGYGYCYTCGAKWRTCSCPLWNDEDD